MVRYTDFYSRIYRQLFLPESYVNKPLADDLAIDPITPQVVTELLKFTGKLGINTKQWTAVPNVVPKDQPLVPVKHRITTPNNLTQVFTTGVPIPEGWAPTS